MPQPPNRGQLAALRRFEDERYIAAKSDIESRLRFDLQSIFIEQVTIGSIITIICIGQGHVAQVPDESYADHPTAPDADATISQCIDA